MEGVDMGFPYLSQGIDITSSKYDTPKYWGNVLFRTLPNAPNLKIHCLYGYG